MANSRPVISLYATGAFAYRKDEASRIAHSTTPDRAILAAFRRLISGDYMHCVVYSGLNMEVFRIARSGLDIRMIYVDPSRAHWLR